MSYPDLARRDFLRLTAGGAALMATGAGCSSGSDTSKSRAETATTAGKGKPTLRIAQWSHYVAGYDQWWDDVYTKDWGERNGVDVIVDHFDINQAAAHAEAEAASRRGHDISHSLISSAAPFEDDVIDHRELVEEVEVKVGKMTPLAKRSILNPKTGKYFGFSDSWWSAPTHFRNDLWESIGVRPDTWEDLLTAGKPLKDKGHPIGIGMGYDAESNFALMGLMHAFGASIQNEEGGVAINSRATVEAVKLGTALFRAGMTNEVFGWDITSNNRYLISGRGSLIVNAIAALRAIEIQDPDLAAKVQLLPIPAGPAGRLAPYAVSIYMIWAFSPNQVTAKKFLVDLATDYQPAFTESQYLQVPSFPGAVPRFGELVVNDARAQPPRKYEVLAGAAEWTTNAGHPGSTNAAVDEVVKASIISQMFAAAAKGEMNAEDAVEAAEAKIKRIYDKWREQGKI